MKQPDTAEEWRIELNRKMVHLSSLLYPLLYAFLEERGVMLVLIGGLFTLLVISEILRRFSPVCALLYSQLFGFALRDDEHEKPVGATYFLLGALVTVLLFDRSMAIIALVVLVLADLCASLIGMRFGKVRLVGRKTLEGTLAFAASALVIAALGAMFYDLPLVPLLLAALAATGCELFNKQLGIDDNILIPVSFAAFATFLS